MAEKRKRGLFRTIIRFITFVDLPIRKKFLLFSTGVLFWFLVLSSVSFYVLIDVNMKTSAMVKVLFPYDRAANEVLSKSSMNLNAGLMRLRARKAKSLLLPTS